MIWTDIWTCRFKTLSTIVEMWKQSNCLLANGWVWSLQCTNIQQLKGRKFCMSYNVNEPWGQHTKWNKLIKENKCCLIQLKSYQIHRNRKQKDGFQGLGREGTREFLFNTVFHFCRIKRILESDGCIKIWMHLISVHYHQIG